jgi:hypothetical protein
VSRRVAITGGKGYLGEVGTKLRNLPAVVLGITAIPGKPTVVVSARAGDSLIYCRCYPSRIPGIGRDDRVLISGTVREIEMFLDTVSSRLSGVKITKIPDPGSTAATLILRGF